MEDYKAPENPEEALDLILAFMTRRSNRAMQAWEESCRQLKDVQSALYSEQKLWASSQVGPTPDIVVKLSEDVTKARVWNVRMGDRVHEVNCNLSVIQALVAAGKRMRVVDTTPKL